MNDRPTPSQARLLRALQEYQYTEIVWNGQQARWRGPVAWQVEKTLELEGVRLRSPTVRRLVREGWIEPVTDDKYAYQLSHLGEKALEGLNEDDFISPTPDLTAEDVHRALMGYFAAPDWWYLREVQLFDWWTRRVDALVLQLARPHRLHAIEIKVARGDFLRELEEPQKRIPARQLAHFFSFAAPAGLIKEHELPEGCGLFEVHGKGKTSFTERVKPLRTRAERPTWELVASLARSHLR